MAYFLEAFVFRAADLKAAELPGSVARVVMVSPKISLVPLIDELLEEARVRDDNPSRVESASSPLPPKLESWARRESQRGCVGYIAAEYFGGSGGQFSIVWFGGEIVLGPLSEPDAINQALRRLGVTPVDGHDEFDTIGLGRHRHTHEWV